MIRRPVRSSYWPPGCVFRVNQGVGIHSEQTVMRVLFVSLLVLAFAVEVAVTQTTSPEPSVPLKASNIVGRWRVKFTLAGGGEKNLVFEALAKGSGSFQLQDTALDDKPVLDPQAAVWSFTKNNLSISGDAELPLGTCCRETGTLIFKAKAGSGKSFSGKLVFVTNVDEEESPYKFHSAVGTFTATRLADN